MGDIRSFGARGEAVHQTAQKLATAKLLTPTELAELQNGTFSQKDYDAANAAIARVTASTPDGMKLMLDASKMSGDLGALSRVMPKDPSEPKQTLGGAIAQLFKVMTQ